MNCKYMNMLRVVRGNAFKLKIAVEAYTPSGRRIDSFALGEAVLKLDKNGTLTTKEYTILEGTTILVAFDGSESLGVYGFQMSGEYEGEAWRWANAEIFQIVESNVKAHIPEGCVLLDDTYNMALKIVLSGGDGVTFTPSVSEQGIISWTNDGGLPNPEPRNIRGPRGEQGPQGEVGPQGPRGQMGLRGQIGPKGDKGDKGDTGATPVLDVTASVDENVGNPMVVVESFGPAEHRTFDFQFKNLKGQKGETGATGPQGPQGQQGEPGNYTKPASGIPMSDLNGNVASGIVYDVTANNSGATFASLSALLSSGSLSTLIPTDVRKGGMQIRFVQSSDNNYVQYMYKVTDAATAATFTNVANWEKMNLEDDVYYLEEVSSGLATVVKGTIYNGNIVDDPYAIANIFYFKVKPQSTISISRKSGISIRISEYNANKVYIRQSSYSEIDTYTVGNDTKYVRISGKHTDNSSYDVSDFDKDFGITTILPSYAIAINDELNKGLSSLRGDIVSLENSEYYLKDVRSNFQTIVQGTIWRGNITDSTTALSNKIYFKVKPQSTITIARKSGIKVRISEYNASLTYVGQSNFVEIDSFTVGGNTEYVRISGVLASGNAYSVSDFDDDFGISAILPRYIKEINDEVNVLNGAIQASEQRSSLKCEQRLSAFYTFGELIIDNVNQQFKCTANIVTKIGSTEYIIPANTTLSYSTYRAQLTGSIAALALDTQNNTFKVVNWRNSASERLILIFGNITYDANSITINNVSFSSIPYKLVNQPEIAYPYEYFGERVDWGNNYYKRTQYKSFGLGWNQSCVCHDDYFLSFENANNTVRLYDLTDDSLLLTKSIPNGSYNMPHCNAACLGDTLYSANSIMPLVYVSQWNVNQQRACFVYDVTLTGGVYDVTLVQVINLASISSNLVGEGACDFAVFKNILYAISYKTNSSYYDSGNNKTLLNVFNLPSAASSEVVLTDSDVLTTKELPLIYMRQDLHVNGGNIYVAGGGNENDEQKAERKITVLNTLYLEISSVIPLTDFSGEPEGLTEHQGNLIITNTSGVLYRIDFK